jgi:hypothetical protein
MLCQLKSYDEAVIEIPFREKLKKYILRKALYNIRRIKLLFFSEPESENSLAERQDTTTSESKGKQPDIPLLSLKPGERVRVKSYEKILQTLNSDGKFQGLAYTPAMKKYCGGTYTVYKRVERVFDERKWKLSRIKNVVLLEGVYCDGAGGIEKDWDGCDRACFIWWKEGWLERVSEE